MEELSELFELLESIRNSIGFLLMLQYITFCIILFLFLGLGKRWRQ